VILQEIELKLNEQVNEQGAPLRPNGVGSGCNFLVQDPATTRTLFYSRIVGGGDKCMFRYSSDGQAWLAQKKH
jgi:hypothetical protein